jgi:hypothetical protein
LGAGEELRSSGKKLVMAETADTDMEHGSAVGEGPLYLSSHVAQTKLDGGAAEPLSKRGVLVARIADDVDLSGCKSVGFTNDLVVSLSPGREGEMCFASVTTLVCAVDMEAREAQMLMDQHGCVVLPWLGVVFGEGEKDYTAPVARVDARDVGVTPILRSVVAVGAGAPTVKVTSAVVSLEKHVKLAGRNVRWFACHVYSVTGMGAGHLYSRCTMRSL